MCSIAGIISKKGKNVSSRIVEMLSMLKHRGPHSAGVAIDNEAVVSKEPALLDLSDKEGTMVIGYTGLSINARLDLQPFIDCKGQLFLVHDGKIYNSEEIRRDLTSHTFETAYDSETIVHLIEEKFQSDIDKTLLRVLPQLDGSYAFAVMRGERIAIARDPVGVEPLYWGENQEFFAFASERKAMWRIGVGCVRAFPPGHVAVMTKRRSVLIPSLTLSKPKTISISQDQAASELKSAIYSSVRKRIEGLKEVAISFSGGVDSSLIAKISDDLGVETTLYTVGTKESHDIEVGKKTASKLGYNLYIQTVSDDDLEDYVPKVTYAIEEDSAIDLEIGLPLYIASECAHKHGIRVILSGQGSDELFGGYHKYLRILQSGGYRELDDEMWGDILQTYKVNLQRDDAVAMANAVETRVPFLDLSVINIAMAIPSSLKISGPDDKLRKRILRKTAELAGLPREIANTPKKAAQYGSGFDSALRRIAKKRGYRNIKAYAKSVFDDVTRGLV